MHHAQLVEGLTAYSPTTQQFIDSLGAIGMPAAQAQAQLDRMVGSEAFVLATNDIFWVVGVALPCADPAAVDHAPALRRPRGRALSRH